jgi:tetratricopeptide (TPR) repeat protein
MAHDPLVSPQFLTLNELGILTGTDKSSLGHGYLRHYDRLFSHLRHRPFTLLEIGIEQGSSLLLWQEYFSTALIVGIDINPACRQFATNRCLVEIGSQADPAFLRQIGQQHRPQVIIDDGSHRADHIVFTFEHLFPQLEPGGLYCIEDMHFHVGGGAAHWRGEASSPPQDYFLHLARLAACPQSDEAIDRALVWATDSVEFMYGLVVIRKKPAAAGVDPIASIRPLVHKANNPLMWTTYAIHVLNNNGDPQEAAAAARHAIGLQPDNAISHYHLSLALERAGDHGGAAAAARAALHLHPGNEEFRARIAMLERAGT